MITVARSKSVVGLNTLGTFTGSPCIQSPVDTSGPQNHIQIAQTLLCSPYVHLNVNVTVSANSFVPTAASPGSINIPVNFSRCSSTSVQFSSWHKWNTVETLACSPYLHLNMHLMGSPNSSVPMTVSLGSINIPTNLVDLRRRRYNRHWHKWHTDS